MRCLEQIIQVIFLLCKDEMNIILFLLPFYIIRYEKQVKEIDEDDAIFQGLMEEYRVIEEKLEKELLYEGKKQNIGI